MAHPNERLIRKAYDAFGRGDLETVSKIFADDIAFHVPGRSPLSGDYVGKEQTFGVFGRLAELTGNTFRTEVYASSRAINTRWRFSNGRPSVKARGH